ncbi:WD40 repeat domain-containing protein [Streptomyces canus]|nr:hypothetical protein [Streptomyces canus]
MWDADTSELRTALTQHTAAMNAMAFSPDGRTLAGSYAGTVRPWDVVTSLDPARAIKQICHTFNRDLTQQERAVYPPGESADHVCLSD